MAYQTRGTHIGIKEIKKYCFKCGKEMEARVVDVCYDEDTGQMRHDISWKCPQRRWWNLHGALLTDEKGNAYAVLSMYDY